MKYRYLDLRRTINRKNLELFEGDRPRERFLLREKRLRDGAENSRTAIRRELSCRFEDLRGPGDGGLDLGRGWDGNASRLAAVPWRTDDPLVHRFSSSASWSGFQTLDAVHARAVKRARRARRRSGDGRRASKESTRRVTSAGAEAGTARRTRERRPAGASRRTFSQLSVRAVSSAGGSGVTPVSASFPVRTARRSGRSRRTGIAVSKRNAVNGSRPEEPFPFQVSSRVACPAFATRDQRNARGQSGRERRKRANAAPFPDEKRPPPAAGGGP